MPEGLWDALAAASHGESRVWVAAAALTTLVAARIHSRAVRGHGPGQIGLASPGPRLEEHNGDGESVFPR
jgi:hypothetical protein